MTYEEWEKAQDISPISPEAQYAEKAWNEALRVCENLIKYHHPDDINSILEDVQELKTD